MPREVALFGLYLPSLTLLFLLTLPLAWALDRLFACLYCALALLIYH